MRLLLVEDDARLAEELSKSLSNSGYAITHARNAKDAIACINTNEFVLVILDLGLPDMDGLMLLKTFKKSHPNLSVIILTARDTITDKIVGLDAGADDYLAKPFDIYELLARLRVMERRLGTAVSSIIEVNTVQLDVASHQLTVQNTTTELPRREFMVLKTLMENAGRIQNKRHLEHTMYQWEEEISSNTIEVHIHNLRKRLPPNFIKTIRGVGYSVAK